MDKESREPANHHSGDSGRDIDPNLNGDSGRRESSKLPIGKAFSSVGLTIGILGGLIAWAAIFAMAYVIYRALTEW